VGLLGYFFAYVFPLIFVGSFVMAIYGTVARTRAARRIAMHNGMNEEDAASTALWNSGGLDTTYLAANLHAPAPTVPVGPPRPAPPKSVEDRLRELDRLKHEGMITPAEYDAQRKTIVGGI
jgi:hypothetical protein